MTYRIPFGIHVGKPPSQVPPDYLLWAVSRAGIRVKRPDFVKPALAALRDHLDDIDAVADALERALPDRTVAARDADLADLLGIDPTDLEDRP